MSRRDNTRSWFVLVGAVFLNFVETGIVKSLGVLLPAIREEFGAHTWVIGLAISLTPGFGSIICLLSGAVTKIIQPRVTIIVCAILCSLGLFATAYATNVYVLVATSLLTGFATGTTTICAGALPLYFDKYYNVAFALLLSGMSLGMVVMPVLTQFLLDVYGWRGATLLLTGISLHAVIGGAFYIRKESDYKQVPSRSDENENTVKNQSWTSYIKQYFDVNLFSNLSFVALVFIYAGNGYITTGWLIYAVPHALDLDFPPYDASLVATTGGIANLLGNCVLPVANKLVSAKVQLYVSIIVISASFAFDAVASIYYSYIGILLCNFSYGLGKGVMSTACYAVLKDVISEDQMTNAVAWMFAAFGLMSVVSGFLCGWLFDETGSYVLSYLILSAVGILTFIPQCIDDVWIDRHIKHKM